MGKGTVMAGSHSVCFDRAADFYDATRSFPPAVEEEIADAILAAVGATPETHFLEVGIGTGRIALPLIRRGCPYTGIDISERMLAVLRRKNELPHRVGGWGFLTRLTAELLSLLLP
ncbi:class I SAM-dependent DNA methyltransferase, partial [Synechococcus sp. H55.10]|uniref:class I SAM-dependent DNA methyltransferase n=1 Tax=Synechococcus sp. H55.10 TaxID=2964503 RepID=UPI0039C6CFF1